MVMHMMEFGEIKKQILRISSADFFHCQITDSIYLDCAESLITKRQLKWQLILSVSKFQGGDMCK